jgi:hypothetical protein
MRCEQARDDLLMGPRCRPPIIYPRSKNSYPVLGLSSMTREIVMITKRSVDGSEPELHKSRDGQHL